MSKRARMFKAYERWGRRIGIAWLPKGTRIVNVRGMLTPREIRKERKRIVKDIIRESAKRALIIAERDRRMTACLHPGGITGSMEVQSEVVLGKDQTEILRQAITKMDCQIPTASISGADILNGINKENQ